MEFFFLVVCFFSIFTINGGHHRGPPQPIPSFPLTCELCGGSAISWGLSGEPHPPLPSKMLCVRLIRMGWLTHFHLRRLFVEEEQQGHWALTSCHETWLPTEPS